MIGGKNDSFCMRIGLIIENLYHNYNLSRKNRFLENSAQVLAFKDGGSKFQI